MARMPKRISFSLATFLLLGVVMALLLSNAITSRQLQNAQAEVEWVRQNFGYINVGQDERIYVTSIPKFQHSRGAKLRFHLPVDRRYLLRISEVDSSWDQDDVASLSSAENSTVLNGIVPEEVIVAYNLAYDLRKRQPILVVHSYERQSTYAPSEWRGLSQLDPQASHLLVSSDVSQREFGPGAVIALASFSAPGTDKTVVLWLEPQQASKSKQSK